VLDVACASWFAWMSAYLTDWLSFTVLRTNVPASQCKHAQNSDETGLKTQNASRAVSNGVQNSFIAVVFRAHPVKERCR